jgi:hypothetical protein
MNGSQKHVQEYSIHGYCALCDEQLLANTLLSLAYIKLMVSPSFGTVTSAFNKIEI